MVALDLISREITPLRTDQNGKDALMLLSEFHVRHLPVVENLQLVGLVSEEAVYNHKLTELIGTYDLSPRHITVGEQDHVFEVMRVMGENRLTIIPVVDGEGKYLGLVSQGDLMRFFSETTSFTEPGGILVLEMEKRDYSLSKIAAMVEAENASILSVLITSTLQSEQLEVTLKVNKQELNRVAASLERHDIYVKNAFTESDFQDNLKERYDSLMSWLNV
jgi:acetoin utilization protein AcuB